MNRNAEILATLIEEDFGIKLSGNKYGKAIEHDSLVLDRERGIFFWNSENIVGDPLIYLTRVRNYSFDMARDYLKNFGYTGTHVYTIQSNGEDIVVYPELVDTFFDLGRDKREYFYERGLTDYTIDRFQLGWYNNFNMIPIFDNNTFRNFQMRRDNPKTIRPYYRGVGGLLFNSEILKLSDIVYFVEGPVDVMILSQNGIPAVCSTVSGYIHPTWFHRFLGQKIIYVCMDNDEAGRKEARGVAKILGITRCRIYTFTEFEEKGYDPVDFFREGYEGDEFIETVKEKSKFIFELEKEK